MMNTEELNALKYRAYYISVEHGFHKEEKPDAYYLGLVMSEMGEAINADRKGWHGDGLLFEDDEREGLSFVENFKKHIENTVEEKLANIVIRLLDFAGMKGYTLYVGTKAQLTLDSTDAFLKFEEGGMPGILFYLMDFLAAGFDWNYIRTCIYNIIYILEDCFGEITGGSDCDLWWFVKKKMQYNDLRPILNGKKY